MNIFKTLSSFIPSIVFCAAVTAAFVSGTDESSTDSALAKISDLAESVSEPQVTHVVLISENTETTLQGEGSSRSVTEDTGSGCITIGKTAALPETDTYAADVSDNSFEDYDHTLTIEQTDTVGSAYRDGTYTGSGRGFNGGTTTATVTVKDGKIAEVSFTNQDTPSFFSRALTSIEPEILSNGKESVDTVSGATYSSNGIIESVSNALKKALNKETNSGILRVSGLHTPVSGNTVYDTSSRDSLNNNSENSDVSSENEKTGNEDISNSTVTGTSSGGEKTEKLTFVPGKYIGTAVCGPDLLLPLWDEYTVSVSVTVRKDGSIEIGQPEGKEGYYEPEDGIYLRKASAGMLPQMESADFIEANVKAIDSADSSRVSVDTVSGATFSSKAIKEACVKALSQAVSCE